MSDGRLGTLWGIFHRPVEKWRRKGIYCGFVAVLTCFISFFPAREASADEVVINKRFPLESPDQLSPPYIDVTNECATSVRVLSVVPHATVQVFLNGTTKIADPFVVKYGSAAVPLNASHPQFKTGDRISATQMVNGITSKQTDPPMVVGAMPAALPPPVVDTKIYACGRVAPVRGLVSGVSAELVDFGTGTDPNAPSTSIGKGTTPNDWGNDWAPIVTPSLVQGHQLRARQMACTGVTSGLSAQPSAVLTDPPLNKPKIFPWVPHGDAVTLGDLLTGANIKVGQSSGSNGGGLATGDTNWVGVAPPLGTATVEARQDLCTEGPPARQQAAEKLATPVLASPICPDQPTAFVRNTTINATLVLLVGGGTHGYGGAAPGDAPLNISKPARFALGDTVQVAEYIADSLVFSNKVTVGCFTRHNIASLNPDGPEIASLRRGIAVMMSRPATDPTSWIYQANMHATVDTPALQLWNQCQHASFYFFPWHRMYMYYLERILRAASGDPNLTLPYWNYSDPPPQGGPDPRQLPLPYRSPANSATNPLFVAARSAALNSGGRLPASAVDYASAFNFINFDAASGSGPSSFGGPTVMHHDTGGDSGALESTPHNVVHSVIGGWMGDPTLAARDPLFYLHHVNIDRLWGRWLKQGGGRQDPVGDPQWMNQAFSFFDENGQKVTLTSKDVLDTFGQLSYCYDDDPMLCH
jgi:hypothetical protein